MDPLVEMQPETWEELRNLCRQNLPQAIVGVNLLDLQISYPELRKYFKFNLYCPFGDMNNGFVAILLKKKTCQVSIQPLNSIDPIEEAMKRTSVIDWNQVIMVPAATLEIIECLLRIEKVIGVKTSYDQNAGAVKFVLPGDSPYLDISSYPVKTYVSGLKAEDINLVNSTWTYQGEDSYYFLESLMKCGLTWGLYSSVDHKLLSWVTVSETGFLTHLYCVEAHRRKGYAEHIIKVAINDLLAKGINTVAFTLENNVSPQKLFIKLGFKRLDINHWVFISKA